MDLNVFVGLGWGLVWLDWSLKGFCYNLRK